MFYRTNERPCLVNYSAFFSRAAVLTALTVAMLSFGIVVSSQQAYPLADDNLPALNGSLDKTFAPVLSRKPSDGYGNRTAYPLPDGKMLVAGDFKVANGVIKLNLARLNSDGSLDNSFGITLGSTVGIYPNTVIHQVVPQPDGKLLIGGTFNLVNDASVNNIARLNADGTLDTDFDTGIGAADRVTAIAVQPDGKILVGGDFWTFNGVQRKYLVRLNANGSVDNTLSPTIGSNWTFTMNSIVPLSDGKILIQGRFNTINGSLRRGLARLNADGTIDSSFVEPGTYSAFNNMNAFALRPDGKMYIGGSFEIGGISQLVCRDLCRLNSDGTLDTSYFVAFVQNASVNAMYLQPDGRLLIHGNFQTINGLPRNGTTRLNADGTIDSSFNPNFNIPDGSIAAFIPLVDGRILLPGNFVSINGAIAENMARIDADGNLDTSFTPSFAALASVTASSIQPDGKILVAGEFNRVNGNLCSRLARFNSDGTVDPSFNVPVSGFEVVNRIVLQPDGKILIGGGFAQVNGQMHRYLARLNSNGSVDSSFSPILTYSGSGGGSVNSIAAQPDGKILIGGAFQTVNGAAQTGYARLEADGSLDTSFVIPFDSSFVPIVSALLTDSNGKTVIGGSFRFSGNTTTLSVARLNVNGSLDTSFALPAVSTVLPGYVQSLAKQSDGKILVGGSWQYSNPLLLARINADGTKDTSFNAGKIGNGYDSDKIYSIIVQPNGKIIIGGSFSTVNSTIRLDLARLIDNGGLDYSFSAPTVSHLTGVASPYLFVHQLADNSLIVAGAFSRIGNDIVTGLARLAVKDIGRQPMFDFDGDGKDDAVVFRPSNAVWYSLRSQGGSAATQFGVSTDKIIPTDLDGDGRTDITVYRDGFWYWLNSSNGSFNSIQFGVPGDIPVPADYDGDGKADVTVFRPSSGTWFVLGSTAGFSSVSFGMNGDVPTVGDFDGDGKADVAVFRPTSGTWYRLNSSTGGFVGVQFGQNGDKVAAADYTGDGKTDIAIWRPSNGTWYIMRSEDSSFYGAQFGVTGDLPTPGDYDGDGKGDVAVFRPSSGTWFEQRSTSGFTALQFGANGDKPVPNAFVY